MQKKALYVRFKGIPEGANLLLAKIAKSLVNKQIEHLSIIKVLVLITHSKFLH
jgi:hypothetical protein